MKFRHASSTMNYLLLQEGGKTPMTPIRSCDVRHFGVVAREIDIKAPASAQRSWPGQIKPATSATA